MLKAFLITIFALLVLASAYLYFIREAISFEEKLATVQIIFVELDSLLRST